jgi:uncharacterized protein with PQ loop repeat
VIITILAWTGVFLSCLITIPQAIRTLRSYNLDGLSAATYWLIGAGESSPARYSSPNNWR